MIKLPGFGRRARPSEDEPGAPDVDGSDTYAARLDRIMEESAEQVRTARKTNPAQPAPDADGSPRGGAPAGIAGQ